MDAVSLADVANVVTFIAPGYFAIQVYSLAYAKRDRDFARLTVESVVYSLPIVTLTNLLWLHVFMQDQVDALNASYAVLLLAVAVLAGGLFTVLRPRWPVRNIAEKFGLGSPDEDFVKNQLLRIDSKDSDNNTVLIKLKSGSEFSGTVDRISRHTHDGPKYYYISNLAWLNDEGGWEERDGGVIVERSEIEYIETPKLKA